MPINDSNKQEIKHLNQDERRVYASIGRYTNINDRRKAKRNGVCPSLGYQYYVRKGYALVYDISTMSEKGVCPNLGYRYHVRKRGMP